MCFDVDVLRYQLYLKSQTLAQFFEIFIMITNLSLFVKILYFNLQKCLFF